jgi:hypothetical protein
VLTVVTWLWKPPAAYRSQFRAEHVNTLRAMVARHYRGPHEFACVTDMPKGLDPRVRVVLAWNDFAGVASPHGGHNPSCYRRLRAFSPEIGAVLGQRFVSLDLDTVVTGDLGPVWDRPEEFVIWGETNPRSFYNGSMWLLTAGARPQVWQRFDPATSPKEALAAGRFGSDQGWLSHVLGPGEATWTKRDGVYSFSVHLRRSGRRPAGTSSTSPARSRRCPPTWWRSRTWPA